MEIKLFKKEKTFKKGGLHTRPSFFWGMLLLIGFVLVLSSCVFGFLLFSQTSQTMTTATPNDSSRLQTISKSRIDKVLKYFTDRQTKSADVVSNPSPVIDPSL